VRGWSTGIRVGDDNGRQGNRETPTGRRIPVPRGLLRRRYAAKVKSPGAPALQYTPLEKVTSPRPVDKLAWIAERCRGQFVLDLGAYDETAMTTKKGTPWWLHGRLAEVARRVVGVDNSKNVPDDGLVTSERSVIVRGDVYDLGSLNLESRPDVVVAGELIEHLPDAVGFLRSVLTEPSLAGATLILTTPNAASAYNAILGVVGRESTHQDHLAIHSYKTLSTVCSRAGLREWQLIPYLTRFPEMMLSSNGALRLGVAGFQRVVNVIERWCPLLSGGWIVVATV
jgi:hypothetical protein